MKPSRFLAAVAASLTGTAGNAAPEPAECRLAYGLHEQFGRVCSRKGGSAVCGECIADPDAPAMGFRRTRQTGAAERDVGATVASSAPEAERGRE